MPEGRIPSTKSKSARKSGVSGASGAVAAIVALLCFLFGFAVGVALMSLWWIFLSV